MKAENTNKSVSNMDVLKDIRGLLSGNSELGNITADPKNRQSDLEAKIVKLETQVKDYEELVQKQQKALQRITTEKEQVAAKLNAAGPGNEKVVSLSVKSDGFKDEVSQLEARIDELSTTLSQTEDLIKLKSQELMQKIARIFMEAGQGEVAIEFRKTASSLESAENCAHFLRELLNQ
ncbi:MAG: hypothetical protein JW967_08345 [Dehalococcoidales bacterium]|nr:hypothetical protein [Dehalococcoidales bacterium]